MAADCSRVVCAIDYIPAHTGIKDRVMKMWKTAAYADGKPIHSLWKRTRLSHRSANRFPTATPDQAVYTQSHNACCCEYPSHPFLSNIRKQIKQDKKRAGVQPSDEPKSCTPIFTYRYTLILFDYDISMSQEGCPIFDKYRFALFMGQI